MAESGGVLHESLHCRRSFGGAPRSCEDVKEHEMTRLVLASLRLLKGRSRGCRWITELHRLRHGSSQAQIPPRIVGPVGQV